MNKILVTTEELYDNFDIIWKLRQILGDKIYIAYHLSSNFQGNTLSYQIIYNNQEYDLNQIKQLYNKINNIKAFA